MSEDPPSSPHPDSEPTNPEPTAASGSASLQLSNGGPYPPNDDERLIAMLIHLVAVLSGFVGPLVLWLIKREGSKFIDHNGKEALNFQISIYAYSFTIFVVGLVIALATSGKVLFVTAPLALLLPLFALGCEILSCLKAHRGKWIRYPLTIRIIR